jgi:hypothetical protein
MEKGTPAKQIQIIGVTVVLINKFIPWIKRRIIAIE